MKVTMTKEGTNKMETFTLCGRKIPLLDIRKNMPTEHESMGLMRIRSDSDYDLINQSINFIHPQIHSEALKC